MTTFSALVCRKRWPLFVDDTCKTISLQMQLSWTVVLEKQKLQDEEHGFHKQR